MAPRFEGPDVEVSLSGLALLDPATEGVYELWIVGADGAVHSAGRMPVPEVEPFTVRSPAAEPTYLMLTVEPPGDADATPSLMPLLGGRFLDGGEATLDVTGYLTPVGIPLEPRPGVHVLGLAGGGEPADAGLWLVDSRLDSTQVGFFQTFAPLTRGWSYEGWIVRDAGTPDEVWLSYGQFLPNNLRKARQRDDTGIGPFSGRADYEQALISEINYPGDDWLGNRHGLPLPEGLSLPLDLNGDGEAGTPSRWTHVVTIEPRWEPDGIRTEDPWEARPFFLRPYRNAVGEASAAEPRTIHFFQDALPRGSARVLDPP